VMGGSYSTKHVIRVIVVITKNDESDETYHKPTQWCSGYDYRLLTQRFQIRISGKVCGEDDGIQSSTRLHRILSKDNDYKMGAFRLPSRVFTSTDQEVAEHLLETHFPGCQPISEPQSKSQPITPSTEDWLVASSVITEEKIRWAFNGFGSYKTAGEDGIFPGVLQQGIETLDVPLCRILTACLAFGYVCKA
jgi:hypothetical protein